MVLAARTSADPNGAHNFSVLLERHAPGEDHDLAVVRRMNSEKLPTRLAVSGKILGGDVERARGVGLLLRNIDAANPGAIHAHVGHKVAALVDHSNVHRLTNFLCLFLSRGDRPPRSF